MRLDADDARRAGHGVAITVAVPAGAGEVLLVDDEGAIAIAEPRDGALKPVVGFRA